MSLLPETVPSGVLPEEISGGVLLDVPHESEGGTAGLVALMRLDAGVRAEVETWADEFAALTPPIGAGLVALARRHGCSYSTARKRYDQWSHNGRTALSLAPAKAWAEKPRADAGPDAEFGTWYHDLCLQFQRSNAAAYREFVRRFKRGDLIPGLEHVLNRRILPRGYSQENLREFLPTQFERVAARVGRRAAADYRPLVFTTRANMEVGHQYQVDDMWHDFKVVMLGQPEPMRLLELHALDVFSGCLFAHAVKPRMFDQATGKSVGLKENEFLYFLTWLLCKWGYHAAGTTIIGEKGTASLDDPTAALLSDVTGGLVRFDGGVVDRRPSFGGQFTGTAKGNFRVKAALESLGNLSHNEMAGLLEFPGQVGSLSRVNEPEGLQARERHQRWLMRACAALPPEIAQAMRHDFVEFNQAVLGVARIWEQINTRTDHELEGWEEAGLTTVDWICEHGIVSAGDFAAMPADRQEWVRNTHRARARKLAPREVFARGESQLKRLRPEQAARLLSRVAGREVKVGRDHLISFECAELGPGIHRYAAPTWQPGDGFRAVVNPYWPEQMHLFNARGAWLGAVRRHGSSDRLDAAALEEARRQAGEDEQRLLGPVARAGAAQTRQRLDNARHNAQVIEDADDAQRAARREARKLIERMHE